MQQQFIENFEKNKNLLDLIANSNKKLRNNIINNSNKQQIEIICEIIYNVLMGNINISSLNKNKLNKFKNPIRKLVQKSNLKTKKKILTQQGGFLQFILPAAITGISSIISSLISNKNE
jgi:hypothetical protein